MFVQDSRQTVTSVIFHNQNTLISSGAMDGTVKMWDIRKTSNGIFNTFSFSDLVPLITSNICTYIHIYPRLRTQTNHK